MFTSCSRSPATVSTAMPSSRKSELRTDGEVKLSTGTLYGIIKRLLNDGLIIERRERPAVHDDERRRYYRLTPQGREVAAAEAARLEKVVALARARRLLKKAQPA